jgi:prepilin signal peptidase PulO-like enzyme (type II secretory pathway)
MSVPEILLVLALGLAIGSFLNVVIYRLPRMLEGESDESLSHPSSHCPHLQNAAQNLAQHPLAKLCLAQGTLWFLPSAYPMAIPMRRIDQRLCVALMHLALGHRTYGLFLGDWLEPLARLVCDRLANHIPARCINATLAVAWSLGK